MANYVFETMTTDQAASFTSNDNLIFISGTAAGTTVVDNAANRLQQESIDLTSGTKTLRFAAADLGTASQAGRITFSGGNDILVLGYSTNSDASLHNDALSASAGSAGSTSRLYGFGGADTLTGGAASDTLFGGDGNDTIVGGSTNTVTEADYLYGGGGADTISGGAGNDHIYGNAISSAQGAADGNDVIDAGGGNDYVNGNAGADSIFGGDGNDKLFGGNGNDTVIGGNGFDLIQGNLGDDSLVGEFGNDTIRGGQGNDILDGGNGADSLLGDLGNDTLSGGNQNDVLFGGDGADSLIGGTGADTLSGGAGVDTFYFQTGDAAPSAITTTTNGVTTTATTYEEVTDFVHLTDKLQIANFTTATFVATGSTGATFSTVGDARVYAQQLLDNHTDAGPEVAAVTVGSDTYLFYSSTGSTDPTNVIDSIIKFDGAVTFTSADFISI